MAVYTSDTTKVHMVTALAIKAKTDQESFEALLTEFESLIRVLSMQTSSYYEARDEAEQVLRIELWNAVMTFEDNYGIPFMFYAINCLKKRYKSWVRQRFYRRKSMLERSSTSLDRAPPYVLRIAEPLDDFADVIWRKSVRAALINFIQNQLTDLERQVFTLWYADYSYKEICKCTGRHQKAVDNALSRVKKKLRNSCVFREYWADLQA